MSTDYLSGEVKLKRSLGPALLVLYGLGNILGAGIYVLIGKVADSASSYMPIAFLLASGVAGVTAFTYAEISARFPVSAGEAVYLQQGIGYQWLSVTVGLLICLAGIVSAATVSQGFVGYFKLFIQAPDWLVITILVFTLGGLAAWGVTKSVAVAAMLTIIEIAGLIIVIVAGAENLGLVPVQTDRLIPPMEAAAWSGIMLGAFLAFYAFIGFEDMVNVAEEVKMPQRNMPLGIILALTIATVLYLLVSLVAVMSVSTESLASSDAPIAMLYTSLTGKSPWLISLIGMFAVINGALIQIIMVSRVLYGMSREKWLPNIFSKVQARTRTPVFATLIATLAVWLFAMSLNLVMLAKITSFAVLLVFAFVNISLFRIKRRDPEPQGVTVYPVWVPVVGAISTLALILVELIF